MTKSSKQQLSQNRSKWHDILSLLFCGFSLFCLLSLLSWNLSPEPHEHNWCGSFGNATAKQLVAGLGWSAYLALGIIFGICAKWFFVSTYRISAVRAVGLALLVMNCAVIGVVATDPIAAQNSRWGGKLGSLLGQPLLNVGNRLGSTILALTTLLCLFVLVLDIPVAAIGRKLLAGTAHAGTLALRLTMRGISEACRGIALSCKKLAAFLIETTRSALKKRGHDKRVLTAQETTQPPPVPPRPKSALTVKDSVRTAVPGDDAPAGPPPPRFEHPDSSRYLLPSLDILQKPDTQTREVDRGFLEGRAAIVEKKLSDLGIRGQVVDIHPGPVVTLFEYLPASDVKVKSVAAVGEDLAAALEAVSVRVIAPLPAKSTVGIELPNTQREIVYIREVLSSPAFQNARGKLVLALGKQTNGDIFMTDLQKMPHLLIAGATGTGKSVAINTLIASILYRCKPTEVRLVMVDPKMLELRIYAKIPHLLLPVVTDARKAANTLRWCVNEMMRRYTLLSEINAKDIDNYNEKVAKLSGEMREKHQPLPFIVIIIDELADLMLVAAKDIEDLIARLAQMARAAGIHMILATQTPRADVITGLIKANFKARIAFRVTSKLDSRIILDTFGAESLLGKGDMLLLSPDFDKLKRVHGAYITEDETERMADFLAQQEPPSAHIEIPDADDAGNASGAGAGADEGGSNDGLYQKALDIVRDTGKASASMLQRRLSIGYNRASRMIEQMESDGYIGPSDGAKQREVYVERFQ